MLTHLRAVDRPVKRAGAQSTLLIRLSYLAGLFPTLEQLQLLSSLERHQVTEHLLDEFLADFDRRGRVDPELDESESDDEFDDKEVVESFNAQSQGTYTCSVPVPVPADQKHLNCALIDEPQT